MSGRMNMRVKSKRNAKSNQENSAKEYDPDNDVSVLTKPFATSISSLSGVIKAFNSATSEVQDYLTNECDLLYECRVCTNLFRSLSNFISHKRSYCQEKYNCVVHLKCANKHENEYVNIKESEECKNESDEDVPKKKSLQSLIESLAQKKQFGVERKDFSIGEFYKERNPDIFNNKNDIQLNLEHINGSRSGVYQTFSKNEEESKDKLDEMKLEVKEIHDMLEGQSVVLGPDGKILDYNSGNTIRSAIVTGYSSENLTCGECEIKFATRKTYVSHMKYKHANSRLVYPCPECREVLATSWSVYRHLFNVHRKTLTQVKKLRDQVQAKAYYQIQSSIKKSTHSSRVDDQQRIDDMNQEWMDNFETDNDIQMCGGCGKRFERRAALNSHSQMCSKRIAAKNTIVVNRMKRIATTEEKFPEKKLPKIPKLDLQELKGADRRKPNLIRKRKIGIQIRYDYTKPSDKSSNNCTMKEVRRSTERSYNETSDNNEQTSDSSSHNNDDMMETNVTTNTEEIYSILGIPSERKTVINKDIYLDPEILSIHSSNNTTPNKDETQEDTDSEIEEIFSSSEIPQSDLFNKKKTTPEDRKKNNKLDENTMKLIKLFNSETSTQNKITLDDKMTEYVDSKTMQCLPCNISFGNLMKLRSHMSLHFNWMKYCCDICSYKSYEKIEIIDHINKVHNVDDPSKIEAVIFQIPEWETIEMSSNSFIHLNNEPVVIKDDIKCTSEEIQPPKATKGRGRPPKKKKLPCTPKPGENESTTPNLSEEKEPEVKEDSEEANLKDIALRKMVLEVIFGQNSEPNVETESIISNSDSDLSKHYNSPESNNVSSRPVRNRIKPVDKDFIYDLTEFTDIPRASSQNSHKNIAMHDKNLSRSLDELSMNKNINIINKSGKKPGLKCKLDFPLELSDNKVVDLNLQNEDSSNETATNINCTNIETSLATFELKTEIVNIQQDNDVWIIEDQ